MYAIIRLKLLHTNMLFDEAPDGGGDYLMSGM